MGSQAYYAALYIQAIDGNQAAALRLKDKHEHGIDKAAFILASVEVGVVDHNSFMQGIIGKLCRSGSTFTEQDEKELRDSYSEPAVAQARTKYAGFDYEI